MFGGFPFQCEWDHPSARTQLLFGVVAVSVSIALMYFTSVYFEYRREQSDPCSDYTPLPLASKLSCTVCSLLTINQTRGLEPIAVGKNPLTLSRLVLSMKWHMCRRRLLAMSAMHMDKPLCVAIIDFPTIPAEWRLMFNLNVTGISNGLLSNWEKSTLCENGTVSYECARWIDVWGEWLDANGDRHEKLFRDYEARAVQHIWLTQNKILPCNMFNAEDLYRLNWQVHKLRPISLRP